MKTETEEREEYYRRRGLCYRCEYRAQYHEEKHAPRFQCSAVDRAVFACYMYQPVKPVVLSNMPDEDRDPIYLPAMLRGRSQHDGVPDNVSLSCRIIKGTMSKPVRWVLYWFFDDGENENKKDAE